MQHKQQCRSSNFVQSPSRDRAVTRLTGSKAGAESLQMPHSAALGQRQFPSSNDARIASENLQCRAGQGPVRTVQSGASGSAVRRQWQCRKSSILNQFRSDDMRVREQSASNNRTVLSSPSAKIAQKDASASAVSGNLGAVAAQHGDSDSAGRERTLITPARPALARHRA